MPEIESDTVSTSPSESAVGDVRPEVSTAEIDVAFDQVMHLMQTLTSTLREVQDEASSRVRASELKDLFAQLHEALRNLGRIASANSPAQQRAWEGGGSQAKMQSTMVELAKEMSRLVGAAGIPEAFQRAIKLEMADIEKTLTELAQEANSSDPGGLVNVEQEITDYQSHVAAVRASGNFLNVVLTNIPDGAHEIASELVVEAAKSIGTIRGYSWKNTKDRLTVVLPGFTDADRLAETLNLGEVISNDQAGNSLEVRLDPAKLPSDWEEQKRLADEAERAREREEDRRMQEEHDRIFSDDFFEDDEDDDFDDDSNDDFDDDSNDDFDDDSNDDFDS